MSKCPYAAKTLQALEETHEKLGAALDVSLHYIADDQNGELRSLHGADEVQGNIIQLCAAQVASTSELLDFVACQSRNFRLIPKNWEPCAREAGLNSPAIRACASSSRGRQLLRESLKRSREAGAKGSPTIFVAGELYKGGRSATDFLRATCDALPAGQRPNACSEIPGPVRVRAILINDKRCDDCKTARLLENLRTRFFSKLELRRLDYSDPEGKRLYEALELEVLPALLFHHEVKDSPKYGTIARWMVPTGNYLRLRVPATFDPTAEICDNKKDDTGNGKVDCSDPTCSQTLPCRPEKKRKLDVFIMSQCPFAARALLALKEVLPRYKRVRLDIHYIAERESDGSFKALHGQSEVDENIRQLCARKHFSRRNRYLDYLWCRAEDYRTKEWEKCATGRMSRVIRRCVKSGEGARLLARDIKVAKALDIAGSPTWLTNNKYKFNGITADKIEENLCEHNPRLRGCRATKSKKNKEKKKEHEDGASGPQCAD